MKVTISIHDLELQTSAFQKESTIPNLKIYILVENEISLDVKEGQNLEWPEYFSRQYLFGPNGMLVKDKLTIDCDVSAQEYFLYVKGINCN